MAASLVFIWINRMELPEAWWVPGWMERGDRQGVNGSLGLGLLLDVSKLNQTIFLNLPLTKNVVSNYQ